MAHQTTIVTRTQHDSSAGSPFPSAFVKLKKASCPIPVHYRSATRLERKGYGCYGAKHWGSLPTPGLCSDGPAVLTGRQARSRDVGP